MILPLFPSPNTSSSIADHTNEVTSPSGRNVLLLDYCHKATIQNSTTPKKKVEVTDHKPQTVSLVHMILQL